jgi:hypothetical protein
LHGRQGLTPESSIAQSSYLPGYRGRIALACGERLIQVLPPRDEIPGGELRLRQNPQQFSLPAEGIERIPDDLPCMPRIALGQQFPRPPNNPRLVHRTLATLGSTTRSP